MPLGLTGKLVSGALILTTASIGGIVLNNHLKPKTVGEELQSQEEKYLLPKDSQDWEKLVQAHESNEQPEKVTKIANLNLGSETENKKTNFFKKCSELWNTKIGNSENTTKIKDDLRNWCVNSPKALVK